MLVAVLGHSLFVTQCTTNAKTGHRVQPTIVPSMTALTEIVGMDLGISPGALKNGSGVCCAAAPQMAELVCLETLRGSGGNRN